jgi:uncharacterized protein YdhG (YjbR/CyaY superfamily)
MKPAKNKPARLQTIAAYINAAPKDSRQKLREMRACIRKLAPGSTETLKYGMPAFCCQRILVIFGAFKHHIGFYPTAAAMKPFAKDLTKFVTARGSIQFPLTRPLPLPLIRKIVALRVGHSIEQDGTWRTKKRPGSSMPRKS